MYTQIGRSVQWWHNTCTYVHTYSHIKHTHAQTTHGCTHAQTHTHTPSSLQWIEHICWCLLPQPSGGAGQTGPLPPPTSSSQPRPWTPCNSVWGARRHGTPAAARVMHNQCTCDHFKSILKDNTLYKSLQVILSSLSVQDFPSASHLSPPSFHTPWLLGMHCHPNIMYVHVMWWAIQKVHVHGVSHRAISTHVHVSGLSACEVKHTTAGSEPVT